MDQVIITRSNTKTRSMRRFFALVCMLMLTGVAVHAQKVVSGTVTDGATNEPLSGVTVFEKGTTNGTFTDGNGEFSLTVADDASVLVFRFLNYSTQEVEASGSLDIAMEEDVLLLDEVVVTALGIKREKKQLGYSVQSVGGDDVVRSGETNVISGLNSKVAGVQVISSTGSPGGASFIRVRGSASMTGANQPLIVIDGVPLDNSQLMSGNPDNGTGGNSNNLLSGVANSNRAIDINPNDIADVTVLKGPAASALYGIQAANGVILITTKRGSKAGSGKALNVSYNTSIAIDQVNKMPELQTKYAQGISGNYFPPETGLSVSWGPLADTLAWDGATDYPYDRNGNIVGQSDPTASIPFSNYDNAGTFFQNGITTDHDIALSGGSDNANYRFSIGRRNQKGIVPLSEWGRTTLKLAGDLKLSPRIRTAASVGYTNSGGRRVQQGSNLSGLMLGMLRTPVNFDNSNGASDVEDPSAYILPDGTQRNYRGGGGYDNPYWTINQNPHTDQVNRMYGFTSVTYDAFKWLNIFYRLGTDVYSDSRLQEFAINSRGNPAGQVYQERHNYRHVNSDLWITLSHDFSEKFGGSLMLGNNLYNQNYNRLYTQGDGFTFANFTHISNAQTVLTRESTQNKRTAAVFFDAKASYDDWVFVNVTGRNEWSSTLPSDGRSFFYPSASLGLVITEPLGLSDNNILPYAKLRVSYAQVGNDAPIYALQTFYGNSAINDGWTNGIAFPFQGTSGFTYGGNTAVLGNPALRPEKTSSLEIGADLRFVKNRIGVDFTYYSSASVDQIFAVPVAASSGAVQLIANAGRVENKGIEAILNFTPVKSDNFRWDGQINFTSNRNMVIELAEGVETVSLGGFLGTAIRNVPGQEYGQIYGGTWLRDTVTNSIVIESDSANNPSGYGYPLESGDEGVIGNPNPRWLMGFRNTFTFKGLYFSFLFDIRQGGDIWNGTQGALTFFGRSKLTEDRGAVTVFEGVKGTVDADGNLLLQDETGTSGTFTNNIEATLDEDWYLGNGGGFGNVAEHFVQDGSWVRLREVTLGYELPAEWFENTPFAGINIGASARNLWLSTKYEGIDPETSLMGSVNAQGLDYFNMPNTKSYSFRLGVNF